MKMTGMVAWFSLALALAIGSQAQAQIHGNIQGNTPEEIHARFPVLIEQNFRAGDAERLVGNLQENELAALASAYTQGTAGTTQRLLSMLGSRLSPMALAPSA